MFSQIEIIQIVAILLKILHLTHTIDDDENFYFINNNKYFFNRMKNCQRNYYFDVNYFKCRLCDENFNLIASTDKLSCICDKNSTEIFEYDNILKRPTCERFSEPPKPQNYCSIKFVNATKFSSLRKSIKIFKLPKPSCSCPEKLNENYKNQFCIRHELLKDLRNYQYYKNLPLTQTLNLNYELKFIVFFCKILHNQKYCNYLANLCVLTFYNLEKSSPCFVFYQQQQSLGLDEGTALAAGDENIEYDGGEKLKPFLFYRGNKLNKNLFEKVLDFQFNLDENNINNTMNFTLTSYDLKGNLLDFRPMLLSDLNLCNLVASPGEKLGDRIRFARNFYQKCSVNLKSWFDIQKNMKFLTVFLNYYENNINFIQTVPVLIKNIIDYNWQEDMEKWQLVKRFYLVDTVSGRLNTQESEENELKFYEKFSQISYIKSMNLRFHLPDNDEDAEESNKIVIPLLELEYATLNLSEVAEKLKQNGSTLNPEDYYNVEFSFKIKFDKKCQFSFHLEILFPILVILAFFNSLMQTFFYKIRQQKLEYDIGLLFNFFINLISNVATAFFLFVVIFVIYIFVVYKMQTKYVSVLFPLEKEENLIEILLYFALIFKFIKLLKLFYDMMNIDIFFIDWERPKYNNTDHFMHHSYNKANVTQTASPETPSIASSLKPPTTIMSTTSPSYDSVSAWRNYFVANEWQELITRRKISIFLHSTFVASALLIFGFENWSSIEYFLHVSTSNRQNYLQQYENDQKSDGINGNILLKVAVGIIVYSVVYLIQRLYNFLIYERFIDNCLQQFIDVSSIANISVLILSMDSYGFYIHGRSPHGFSDTDMTTMILQFKREEENLCGHRGLLAGSEQQTYTILAPRNLRNFYEKLIMPLHKNNNYHHQPDNANFKKFETNFEKIILTYHNINRFFGAFIDHALKDVDYVIKEKGFFEMIFDCELETLMNDSKGIFYLDNGHSFEKVLLYGNENTLFQFELILFTFILFLTRNFLVSILAIGIVFKIFEVFVNFLTKRNLARKTLIDKRFLI